MRYLIIITILLSSLCACSPSYKEPHIEIQTKLGDIEIELYPGKAPKTVTTILSYIDSGFYKDCNFYRVLNDNNQPSDASKASVIQGGLWRTKKNRDHLHGIPHESTQQTGILHKDGVISLARLEPGTGTTEFFICMGDQPGFDFGGANNPDRQGYAAFGKVVKGMNIVRRIFNRPESDQYFDPPVPIYNIIRL